MYLTHYKTASTTYTEAMEDAYYPQRVHWFPETYERTHTGMVYVPHLLAGKVLDESIIKYLNENPVDGKSGFILAAGSQAWAGGKTKNPNPSRLTYKYRIPLITLTQIFAGKTSALCGCNDYVATDASACASSLKVMMDIQNLMQNFGFDRICVLALEDAVADLTLEFFGASGANLTIKDDNNGKKVSAFDSVNGGFIVGQGAVFTVFHSKNAVEKLGLEPKAELIGAYSSSESGANAIGQREDGQGYSKAIQGAVAFSKVNSTDISIVKTHGTGTPANNSAEKNGITSVLNDFVATSYKQKIGHTVAASGLLETCLLLDDIKSGQIPAIENRTEDDGVFLSKPCDVPDGLILSLAAGMGNIYSAAIFKGL